MNPRTLSPYNCDPLNRNTTLTLEETVSINKTYEATNIYIKQLRAMVNYNKMDNTNIQAIRTPTHCTMSNNCLKCGKSHAFYREACPAFGSKCNTCGKENHWASVCLSNGTKPKQNKSRGHKAKNTKNQNLTINHNTGKIQYMKTDAVYNNKETEEQMESLTFNCINIIGYTFFLVLK